MNRASLQMRNFAKRLIANETLGNQPSETKNRAPFHACEALRPLLASLIGTAGFRALALASAQVRCLRSVHVNADGALGGLEELQTQADPEQIADGEVVLLAQLL